MSKLYFKLNVQPAIFSSHAHRVWCVHLVWCMNARPHRRSTAGTHGCTKLCCTYILKNKQLLAEKHDNIAFIFYASFIVIIIEIIEKREQLLLLFFLLFALERKAIKE